MNETEPSDATLCLTRAARGDVAAEKEIATATYERLRRLAGGYLRRERPDHTLQPTALVHEAYLRLIDQSRVDWKDRDFFLGLAAREMRRVLLDHARSHARAKRGGGWGRVLLEKVAIPVEDRDLGLLDVEEAVKELVDIDARQGRIVELRFYGGLTVEEVAKVLAISPKTVEKDWRIARTWLYRYLTRDDGDDTT